MPKEITHWMLAEQALQSLPRGSRLRTTISEHRDAYLGGAVLPDTLAHIFRGPFHPKARQLGQRFHDQEGNSYAPLITAELQFPDGIPAPLLSCLLGVVSHMEADIALHPWVYAATGDGGIGEHYRLETAIDVHFIRKGAAPAERRLDRLMSPCAREALVTAAGVLFDREAELPRRALEQSLELHCRFQGMYDQTLWKLSMKVLGKVCGSPYKEQRQLFYPVRKSKVELVPAGDAGDWLDPESGQLRSETLEDLAQKAVEKTVEIFRRIEETGSFATALADHHGPNLLTGLPGVVKHKSQEGG
jgi:hypothetical protein